MDVRRNRFIPRPPVPRLTRSHNKRTRRAIKAVMFLFPTAVLSMSLVSASQATGSVADNFELTSLSTPLHTAIASDATLMEFRLATLASATPAPAPAAPAPAPVVVAAPASAPAPAPAPAVDTSSAATWAASPGVTCIRDHESGDNYSEDTGNGYYGAYQDLLSTWTSHGGIGLPSDAPAGVQDQINYEVYLTGGWGQWSTAPGCGL